MTKVISQAGAIPNEKWTLPEAQPMSDKSDQLPTMQQLSELIYLDFGS
jgi:hypothetical protein